MSASDRTDPRRLWNRYREHLCHLPQLGFALDISRMDFPKDYLESMGAAMGEALRAMARLEAGEIANRDEKRQVGHYWLRAPELAPTREVGREITETLERIEAFAADVHAGRVKGERGKPFRNVLVIGIGGSALGPQLAADALGGPGDKMTAHFFDNTDPDGFDRTFRRLGEAIEETLTLVISKSGGTQETRNATLETAGAYAARGLEFARAAVAITGRGSKLDRIAEAEGWLARFPMWDWVGGRTSELAAVGLAPAALQGIDVREMLRGAKEMDAATRSEQVGGNPAALLALMWHHAGEGRGGKDMVILPYKDRLALFSRYLQQLVMESLGKERDLDGRVVHQGIAVYGNKGSTDQHAYVQQLRDGVNNFFVTFIEVLRDRGSGSLEVEPQVTAGDYLNGFLLGTRRALWENGRESMTITIDDVTPYTLGLLIALFERAVGLYASLVNVNAYHQPGVEAGKRAAADVIEMQGEVLHALGSNGGAPRSAEAIAGQIGKPEESETVFKILEHLAANEGRGVRRTGGDGPDEATYWLQSNG